MRFLGFSDASPSEVISNKQDVLAIAALFPLTASGETLDPPVQQYKAVAQNRKAAKAKILAAWLAKTKRDGALVPGMVNVLTQADAARYGLDLLEELPDTHVIEIAPGKCRLYFGKRHINMMVAVALIYYWTTAHFAALRASGHVPKGADLIVCMDRFPGPSPKHKTPGIPYPKSAGHWFIDYLQQHTETGQHIQSETASGDFSVDLANLSWWRANDWSLWVEGKKHPHFILPDWVGQSAIAANFPDVYVRQFNRIDDGETALDEMVKLPKAFRAHNVWAMGDSVFEHLRPAQRRWTVPDEVKESLGVGPYQQHRNERCVLGAWPLIWSNGDRTIVWMAFYSNSASSCTRWQHCSMVDASAVGQISSFRTLS